MMGNDEFAGLLDRIKQGDQEAAAVIVREYEHELRRFIRFRLSSPSVRRFVDSLDICQSVLAKFFDRMQRDQMDISSPQQLKAMLITMAKNRTLDAVQAQHALRRDARRIQGGDEPLAFVASDSETPSRIFEADEIVCLVRSSLSSEDRYLVDERMAGREWSDLAAEFKTTPEAIRKRVTRALDRVATELKLV